MSVRSSVIFLYKKFFPVVLGSDVHGYNLAKELDKQGYRIFTAHNQQDGFTHSMRGLGLLTALWRSRFVYLRISLKQPYLINSLGFIFRLFGKRLILELNAPFEELRFVGESEQRIAAIKRHFSWLLKFTSGVVVVSEPIKRYLEQEFDYRSVAVIPNGGERFVDDTVADDVLPEHHQRFNERYPKQVIWVANFEYIQGLQEVVSVCEQLASTDLGVVIVDNSGSGELAHQLTGDHILFMRSPERRQIACAMQYAIAGFAFYDTSKYQQLDMEFFNSPLKVYEYIANDLYVISNLSDADLPATANRMIPWQSQQELVEQLSTIKTKQPVSNYRSWADVADDTLAFVSKLEQGGAS